MSCYTDALRMLARRELSEAQVRQRLHRRGHPDEEIDAAIARLLADRAIDDARVAAAIARTETSVKRRGRLRVARQIESAGIAKSTARHALDEIFSDLEPGALVEAALSRRLRGSARIENDKQFQRLYRYLVSQGFESDEVMRVLSARRKRS
jgi:regulatory protein